MIHATDSTTERTGSITMWCRDSITAEDVPLSEVRFWLNQTHACNPSLQERADINVIVVNSYKIKFNLTRHLEGYYACGKCINRNRVLESREKTFICKHIIMYYVTKLILMHSYTLTCAHVQLQLYAIIIMPLPDH